MGKRNYLTVNVDTDVDIDMSDIIENLSDDDILEEVKDRGLLRKKGAILSINYRSICDLFGVNYFTPIPELLEQLKTQLETEQKTLKK